MDVCVDALWDGADSTLLFFFSSSMLRFKLGVGAYMALEQGGFAVVAVHKGTMKAVARIDEGESFVTYVLGRRQE